MDAACGAARELNILARWTRDRAQVRKVEFLAKSLRQAAPGDCAEAIAAVRELTTRVTVIPKGKREPIGLEIEGELAALLSRDKTPSRGTMVAGTRSHLYRTRLHYTREARK